VERWDIVLLTEGTYLAPSEVNAYVQNVLTEQLLVQNALEAKGLMVTRVDWRDQEFDWTSTRAVLFREIWDYFHRFSEFSTWLDETTPKTHMINSTAQIRWNLDKHYLNDLRSNGVNICKTEFVETGDERTLSQIREEENLSDFVLKPAVSGAGRHTYRITGEVPKNIEQIYRELIGQEAMMIQPFQKNVLIKGEVAYMLFDGKYSHAVLKIAKEGEFRVQDDFGGSVHQYDPSDEEIEFAEHVAANTSPLPSYARVDVIRDNNDQLAVAELELIEPELWFRFKPEAADLMADAVLRELGK